MGSAPIHLGIDLGTTNSTAALFDGDRVDLVRTAAGSPVTPSVVRIDSRGNVTVGERARKFLDGDVDNVRSEFKRMMGTKQTIAFPASGVAKSPEQLSAEVLKSLRADVEAQAGFAPERAVISVPALFELPQCSATSEAARLAGFERVELIQEPVASALAAGWSSSDANGPWLVYDLGGGTFDASLLETRDGLLRVVGHDGDNFLGGRDIDWALLEWVLLEIGRNGPKISRSDPQHAAAIRRLKLAVEDAKIELTRAREASVVVPGLFGSGVDVVIPREAVEIAATPIVERSLAVCERLLRAHGIAASALERVVLVGGPTVMPLLRNRVKERLVAPFADRVDPMTVVAQGAALYAATASLDARPAKKSEEGGHRVWLQYPAMSSDLSPHVVGRLVTPGAAGAPARVRVTRIAESGPKPAPTWMSADAAISAEGGFVLSVELLPRRASTFTLEAFAADGSAVRTSPSTFTVVHGLTLGDPPLSRTVGVALANDRVRVFVDRGAPLPAKRTFMLTTVETLSKGEPDALLTIPIVQGEYEDAHLCRLVGAIEIRGDAIAASLPAGSEVEITVELDRGGRLTARAHVPLLAQVFEQVANLVLPDATPDSLAKAQGELRARVTQLQAKAFSEKDPRAVQSLATIEMDLGELDRDIGAARAGDGDAAQKARRRAIEIDAALEDVEAAGKWPELESDARRTCAWALSWMSQFGNEQESKMLTEAVASVERAIAGRQVVELQRQLRLVRDLGNAGFFRHPEAWRWLFEDAAAEASRATDLQAADRLVKEGREAIARKDLPALRPIVDRLHQLLPADVMDRKRAYDSGLR